MSLDMPRVLFHGHVQYPSAERAFWSKVTAYRGIEKLEPSADTAPIPVSTTIDVVWPKRLPGFLSLAFFEDDQERYGVQVLGLEDEFGRKEDEGKTDLVFLRLWRAPGKDVFVDYTVERLWPADRSYFLGSTFNLRVRIRAGEEKDAAIESTYYVKDIPILSGDPGDRSEGLRWEIGVTPFFVPLAKTSLYEPFWEEHALWQPYQDHGTGYLQLALHGGRFGPPAYTNLVRVEQMTLRERFVRDGESVPLADGWVLQLSWAWMSGKQRRYVVVGTLLRPPPNPDVQGTRHYDCDLEFVPTTSLKAALPPLERLPHPQRTGAVWIKDVKVKNPRDTKRYGAPLRLHGVVNAYWRLGEGFDPERGPVSLRAVEQVSPGVRSRPGEDTQVVFEVTSPRDHFAHVVKELLERITLVNGHREAYREYYEANQEELEAWGNVVAPIYNAFGQVKFTVQEGWGYSRPGTFAEYSTVEGSFSERYLEELLAAGKLDLRGTLGKLGGLSYHLRHATEHMQKAWAIFCSDEFQKPFLSGEFLGKGLHVKLGAATDGWVTAAPNISDDERKHLGRALRLHESEYEYGPALILFILNNLALNFSLLGQSPQPKGEGQAAHDAANRAARQDLKARQDQFARNLGARYQELIEADAKQEMEAGVKTSVKWIGAPGKLTLWDSVTGGGLAMLLYGDEAQRRLLSQEVLKLPEGKSFWKLTPSEWDDVATDLRRRHGSEASARSTSDMTFFLGMVGQVVAVTELFRKGVKAELGSLVELADVVVGTMESLIKLGQMLKPVYYRVAFRMGKDIIDGALKGAGMVEKFAKGLGKVAAIVAVVKAGLDIMNMVVDWRNGFDMDWVKLGFKVLELVAAVLFFFNAAVGLVFGALVLIAETIYGYFTETSMEGMMVWWMRTPWGLPLGRAKSFSTIPASEPRRLLELTEDKLNPFLEDVSKKISGKPEFAQIHAYLGTYFQANADRYGLTFQDASTKKVLKFKLS